MRKNPADPKWPKADLLPRLAARGVDLAIAVVLALLVRGIGGAVAVAFLLLADGFFPGQSPGKKLTGLMVVDVRTREPARYRASALRNLPFAAVAALYFLPWVGWLLFPLAAVLVIAVETWMAWTDRAGLRVGDVLADTQVIDGSQPVELPEEERAEGAARRRLAAAAPEGGAA